MLTIAKSKMGNALVVHLDDEALFAAITLKQNVLRCGCRGLC